MECGGHRSQAGVRRTDASRFIVRRGNRCLFWSEGIVLQPWSSTTRGSLPDGPESRTMLSTARFNWNAVQRSGRGLSIPDWRTRQQPSSSKQMHPGLCLPRPTYSAVRAFRQGDVIGAKTRAAARSDPLPFECQTMLLNVAFDVTAWSFIAWPSLSPCRPWLPSARRRSP